MPLLTFTLPLFSLLLLLLFSSSTTTAQQPYNATDYYLLDCGSSSTTISDRIWDSDERSNFIPSNITTASFSSTPLQLDPSVPQTPYSSARIFNSSSFTYTFPVSQGPKFLRLYFYPATYSHLNPNQSYFSVSSNGYSLLSNFSAFLTASYLAKASFVKEFMIYVTDAQTLNVTFTPSPNSYAFINGIEIVSMPEDLYFNSNNQKPVGMTTGPVITNDVALENIYRLNMGGGDISGNEDTGMYRSWDEDNNYILGAAIGLTPVYDPKKPIMYTMETPNYTAPELVYRTQRSMGNMSNMYNLTWIFPVDSGFYYKLRLHFCNIIPQYTERSHAIFRIFINNQTADDEIDLFHLTRGSGYPVFKDYVVFVNDPDGSRSKQYLWVGMHPNSNSELYLDAYLNGLEAFKVSMDGSLASPNPELRREYPPPRPTSPVTQNTKKEMPYAPIIGGVGGGLVMLTILVLVVTRVKHFGKAGDKTLESTSSCHPPLPLDRCRRFSLMEMKVVTCEFDDKCVIGRGGFGTVYKGYIDNAKTTVAIKRLKSSSKQGFHEFKTKIGFLSKLRHVQLVSLIGYCDDGGEMILVYDYMPNGTLREHLYKYKNNNPPLSWKRRLHICIGAAKGLQYLHTGANRAIIHRDVKSTNILLDENWVAKLSDFGLSKLGPKDQTEDHVSTMVKGTIGYMDPEYYRRRQLTDKSDVYSFGVVLLEVLCARPVIKLGLPDEQVNLAQLGKSCYRKGTLHEIIDLKLSGEIAPKCLMKFGEVAYSCLKEEGTERPTMDDVIWGLEFALQLQEDAEKMGEMVGEAMLENQQLPFLMQAESATSDEYVFLGSTGMAIRHDTSSTDSFTEISQPTGG